METEDKVKTPAGNYAIIVPLLVIGVLLSYYAVMMMAAPGRKIKAIKEEYAFRQDPKNVVNDSILTDSSFLALSRTRAFLQARITLAETDSIYLTMNLSDSVVTLEISGVTVSRTKLTRLSVSKMLRDRNSYAISSMLSKPLTVERNYASIPKVPLMIKMAPKDTSEYKPDIIPDTADYEPVNYIMEMDNGIVLHVYQEEKLNRGDGRHLFFFDLGYRLRSTWRSIKRVFTLRVPEYHPYIKVRLPRTDAKIIYRALPEKGQVALLR